MAQPTATSSPRGTRTSRTRRTRFVCISDTHNCTVKLPRGDVLIHAGDLTNQGSYSEVRPVVPLRISFQNCLPRYPRVSETDVTRHDDTQLSKAVQWLEKAPFECKIVIAGLSSPLILPFLPTNSGPSFNPVTGNHDLTLDQPFYNLHSSSLHNQNPQDPLKCLSLLTSSPSIIYLSHSAATIRLRSPRGPRTTFTVFGSPYSPRQAEEAPGAQQQQQQPWAFQYARDADSAATAERLWRAIPPGTDVLVTHTPPHGHRDEVGGAGGGRRRAAGCEVLRRALWRVRPRLHVCGHVHGGRGVERVRWELDGGGGNVRFMEAGVEGWTDEARGTGKMSLVDLTGRRGRALDNDGGHPYREAGRRGVDVADRGDEGTDGENAEVKQTEDGSEGDDDYCYGLYCPKSPTDHSPETAKEPLPPVKTAHPTASPGDGTIGLGFSPATDRSRARSDVAALEGRLGRRETCVVNCAITATSWPHAGGRRFNAPVVVDLDLPVWAWEMEQEDGAFGIVREEV